MRSIVNFCCLVVVICAVFSVALAQGGITSEGTRGASQRTVAQGYGLLPIGFEANEGQSDPSVSFVSHGSGYALFLTQDQVIVALDQMTPTKRRLFESGKFYRGSPRFHHSAQNEAIRIAMAGANPHATITPLDLLAGKS